jgi:GYF domain 2/Domain of unknown function (DUF4282)
MADQWYFTKDGKRTGPVSISEIQKLASNKSLDPQDMVWKNGMAKWVPANSIPGIFPNNSGSNYAEPPDSFQDNQMASKMIGNTTRTAKEVSKKLWFLDLSFEQFATPRLIGVVFLLWMILAALSVAGTLVYVVITMPVWLAALVLVGHIISAIISAVILRVTLEIFLIIFRLVEHLENLKYLREIAENKK